MRKIVIRQDVAEQIKKSLQTSKNIFSHGDFDEYKISDKELKEHEIGHFFNKDELIERGKEIEKIYEKICKDTGLEMAEVVNRYGITKDNCYYDLQNPTEKFYYDLKMKFAKTDDKIELMLKKYPLSKDSGVHQGINKSNASNTLSVSHEGFLSIKKSNSNHDSLGRFTYGKRLLTPDTGTSSGSGFSYNSDVQHDGEFVLTKNGSKDFGEISKELGKQRKRQAGKIRLRIGWQDDSTDKGSGEVHIERPKRMSLLKQIGFNNARDFIEDICNGYDQIYSSGRKLLLVKSRELYTCVIEMLPDNEGAFYDVNTAYVSDKNNIKNKILKKKIGLVWSNPTSLDLSKSLMPLNSKSISSIPRGLIKGTSDNSNIAYCDNLSSKNFEKASFEVSQVGACETEALSTTDLIIAHPINSSSKNVTKSLTYSGYKLQGRTRLYGMDISIENKKGSYRSGVDKDGHKWRTLMHYDYGYIRGTIGVDKDFVDVYIGPDKNAQKVYVIHQNDPVTHKYDEDKCMLCFSSAEEAKKAYMKQYDRPGFFGNMQTFNIEEFKEHIFNKKGTMIKKSQFFNTWEGWV